VVALILPVSPIAGAAAARSIAHKWMVTGRLPKPDEMYTDERPAGITLKGFEHNTWKDSDFEVMDVESC
jgi:hypothetical protein